MGKGVKLKIKRREIALFRHGDSVIAIQNRCPHQHADLAQGYIKDNKIYCYLHHWAFDIETGAYVFNPDMHIKIYQVKVDQDQVLIGIED